MKGACINTSRALSIDIQGRSHYKFKGLRVTLVLVIVFVFVFVLSIRFRSYIILPGRVRSRCRVRTIRRIRIICRSRIRVCMRARSTQKEKNIVKDLKMNRPLMMTHNCCVGQQYGSATLRVYPRGSTKVSDEARNSYKDQAL